jgi:hypothetical protein
MGTRARVMSVVSSAHGRRSPRRITHVGVPALAVSTSERTLEKDPRSVRGRSDLSEVFLGAQIPRGYRCIETATPIFAPCSLSQPELRSQISATAKITRHRRAKRTWVVERRRRSSSYRCSVATAVIVTTAASFLIVEPSDDRQMGRNTSSRVPAHCDDKFEC